jgi:di/tricarboxylate transporter
LSEAAKIALLQEVMREAKRNERGGFITCIVGVIVSVAGFSTTKLVRNSVNLGVLGIAIAAIGFGVYLHYTRVHQRFVGQLASMVSKTAVPCPHCEKPLPEGEFAFCPFCGSALRS